MRIRVLYFAAIRDLRGVAEEPLELPPSVTRGGDLLSFLEASYPALRGRLDGVRIAVNESFVDTDQCLTHGDVVALIPPVAGG